MKDTLFWTLVLSLGTPSCAHPGARLDVALPLRTSSGEAVVRMQVPRGWTPLAPAASRVEFLAPDRRTRTYLRAMELEGAGGCSAAAKRYSTEVIRAWGGPKHVEVGERTEDGDGIRFSMKRLEKAPQDDVIWFRVTCAKSAMAVASCAVPSEREGDLRVLCDAILKTLKIVSPESDGSGKRS